MDITDLKISADTYAKIAHFTITCKSGAQFEGEFTATDARAHSKRAGSILNEVNFLTLIGGFAQIPSHSRVFEILPEDSQVYVTIDIVAHHLASAADSFGIVCSRATSTAIELRNILAERCASITEFEHESDELAMRKLIATTEHVLANVSSRAIFFSSMSSRIRELECAFERSILSHS